MKNIFSLVLTMVLFITSGYSQESEGYPVPYDEEEELIIYTGVKQVMGANYAVLYNRAMKWGDQYYTNFEKKIDHKSKEEGIIRYDAEFRVDPDDFGSTIIRYSVDILFKDGRYKYKIYKLHIQKGYYYPLERWLDPDKLDPEAAKKKLAVVDERIKAIIDSMTSYIASPPKKQEDEW